MPILLAMEELHVARWRKYGKDRPYVNDSAGTRVGWVDLFTGARTLEVAVKATGFEAAVAEFLAAAPGSPAAAPHQPAVAPPVVPVPVGVVDDEMPGGVQSTADSTWVNLAVNVPGQAAREHADAELVAMRDWNRVGAFLARTFDMKTDERAWRVGADGEETVGARLEKLRKHGWHVLHAVPVGDRGSDTTTSWSAPPACGPSTPRPPRRPGLGRTHRRPGQRPRRALPAELPLRGNPRRTAASRRRRVPRRRQAGAGVPHRHPHPEVTIKQAPEGVAVLDRLDIPRAFRRASPMLTSEDVAAVFEHARRSTTWKP